MSDRFSCPACGHDLSHYEDEDIGTSERIAAAIADRVATWWFTGAVLLTTGVWLAVNLIWEPFDPHPLVMLAAMSSALALLAALQGPLILVTQRRAAERDRMRDQEALRVAGHAEEDLHALHAKVDRLLPNSDD